MITLEEMFKNLPEDEMEKIVMGLVVAQQIEDDAMEQLHEIFGGPDFVAAVKQYQDARHLRCEHLQHLRELVGEPVITE